MTLFPFFKLLPISSLAAAHIFGLKVAITPPFAALFTPKNLQNSYITRAAQCHIAYRSRSHSPMLLHQFRACRSVPQLRPLRSWRTWRSTGRGAPSCRQTTPRCCSCAGAGSSSAPPALPAALVAACSTGENTGGQVNIKSPLQVHGELTLRR